MKEKPYDDKRVSTLLPAAQAGEHGALEEIISECENIIRGRLTELGVSGSAKDDVFQEVCIKLFRGIHTFRGEACFGSWLYRVVTNEAYMFLRKERKHMTGRTSIDDLPTALVVEEDAARDLHMKQLVGHLGSGLKRLEKRSPLQAAEARKQMFREPRAWSTVARTAGEKSRIHRARQYLKRHFRLVAKAPIERALLWP